ncbi:hypothetical protein FB45DRAFT_917907 [Roridomyces roridus]|uniref:RING-type domain-containing protein n=1 Tax=Roridomyces roridus TaxID=1738132 RepID=A0AAD7BV07_9AGAR|nr:hypothetical protein FB45DRAFT_917907 [Roridomyces roridus]
MLLQHTMYMGRYIHRPSPVRVMEDGGRCKKSCHSISGTSLTPRPQPSRRHPTTATMSSRTREPLWFCHECNAEMRPLMVPDPVCASCHGSFVEKMENPTDDPREFHRNAPEDGEMPVGLETFLLALQGLANQTATTPGSRTTEARNNNGPRVTRTFEFRTSGGNAPPRAIRIGGQFGPNGGDEDPDQPTMADFLQGGRGAVGGDIMARYLMALLGREDLNSMFARGMGDGPQPGRMGDYVFNQEALDEIITQLMETSNSHRPVAATEEIIENLPREVLEEGSAMLEKDCAVCKEQFKLETDDPDEQVVITLPCKHPFHEPCILPWLKSSGTCPVCRHALVPQPEHHELPPRANGTGGQGQGSRRGPPSPGSGGSGAARDLFQSLFNLTGNNPSGSGSGGNGRTAQGGTRPRSHSDTGPSNHIPGGWEEELD